MKFTFFFIVFGVAYCLLQYNCLLYSTSISAISFVREKVEIIKIVQPESLCSMRLCLNLRLVFGYSGKLFNPSSYHEHASPWPKCLVDCFFFYTVFSTCAVHSYYVLQRQGINFSYSGCRNTSLAQEAWNGWYGLQAGKNIIASFKFWCEICSAPLIHGLHKGRGQKEKVWENKTVGKSGSHVWFVTMFHNKWYYLLGRSIYRDKFCKKE